MLQRPYLVGNNKKFFLAFFLICVATTGNITNSDSFGNAIVAFILLFIWSFPIGILGSIVYFLLAKSFSSYEVGRVLSYLTMFLFANFQFWFLDKKFNWMSRYRTRAYTFCFVICTLLIFWKVYVVAKLYFSE